MGRWMDGRNGVRLSPTGLFRNIGGMVCMTEHMLILERVVRWGGEGNTGTTGTARPARGEGGRTWCGRQRQSPTRLYLSPLPACVAVSYQNET